MNKNKVSRAPGEMGGGGGDCVAFLWVPRKVFILKTNGDLGINTVWSEGQGEILFILFKVKLFFF